MRLKLVVLIGLVVSSLALAASGAPAATAASGAPAATPNAPVAGLWKAIDVADGSVMYLAVGPGNPASLAWLDTGVGVCNHRPGYFLGTVTASGNLLFVTTSGLQCLSGGFFGGPHTSVWTYDPQTDTITTDVQTGNGTVGSVWHRLTR
jgi:hypothetical protein